MNDAIAAVAPVVESLVLAVCMTVARFSLLVSRCSFLAWIVCLVQGQFRNGCGSLSSQTYHHEERRTSNGHLLDPVDPDIRRIHGGRNRYLCSPFDPAFPRSRNASRTTSRTRRAARPGNTRSG